MGGRWGWRGPRRRGRCRRPKGGELRALELHVHVNCVAQHGQAYEEQDCIHQTQQSPAVIPRNELGTCRGMRLSGQQSILKAILLCLTNLMLQLRTHCLAEVSDVHLRVWMYAPGLSRSRCVSDVRAMLALFELRECDLAAFEEFKTSRAATLLLWSGGPRPQAGRNARALWQKSAVAIN